MGDLSEGRQRAGHPDHCEAPTGRHRGVLSGLRVPLRLLRFEEHDGPRVPQEESRALRGRAGAIGTTRLPRGGRQRRHLHLGHRVGRCGLRGDHPTGPRGGVDLQQRHPRRQRDRRALHPDAPGGLLPRLLRLRERLRRGPALVRQGPLSTAGSRRSRRPIGQGSSRTGSSSSASPATPNRRCRRPSTTPSAYGWTR